MSLTHTSLKNKDAKELQLPTAFRLVRVPRKNPPKTTPSNSGLSHLLAGLATFHVGCKNLLPLFFRPTDYKSVSKCPYKPIEGIFNPDTSLKGGISITFYYHPL